MPQAMQLTKRRLALGGAGLAIAAGFAWALMPKPIAVDVAAVTQGPMRVTIDEEGKTRIKDVYVVSAPIPGRVLRSPLQEGETVEQGRSVVAVIQPSAPAFLDARARGEVEAQVKAAEAAVNLAKAEQRQAAAELGFAERELERSKTLSKSGTIPARSLEKAALEVDTRKAAFARAEAAVDVKLRELDSARARLIMPSDMPSHGTGNVAGYPNCCVEVRAPASGKILKITTKSEQVIAAGTALVEIGNPSDLEIVVELLSTDAVKISEGATVIVEGWGGSVVLDATVKRIEPLAFTKVSALGIDEQRVRTIIGLSGAPEQWAALGHDYRVFVRIAAWSQDHVVRVPVGALFRHGDQWAIFKLAAGQARRTLIEIDHRNPEVAEVKSGLAAGDKILLHPSDRVQDGARVVERADIKK